MKFQYYFNDNSGTILSDYSLHNHDAELVGIGSWSSDTPFDTSSNAYFNSPNSFDFDGDYFKHDLSNNWTGTFTLSLWVKPVDTEYRGIFASSNLETTDSFQLDSSGGRWSIRSTHSSGDIVYDFADVSLNNWQHIAVTWDYPNETLKLFFNGVLSERHTPIVNYLFDQYIIGKDLSDNYFKGLITSALLYDKALVDADINSLYSYKTDPSGSIHGSIHSDTCPIFPTTQHIFLPVYLDGDKIIVDSSQNSTTTLDASYNFVMNATYTTANYMKLFLKYKKVNNDYTFKFNESYKILFEQALKNDIQNTFITQYDSSFNSGVDPGEASLGRMFVRYIADSLMGHPFAQAFIANESEIINSVVSSNLHLQLSTAMKDGLTTNSFNANEVCKSVIVQFADDSPDRFFNEVEDTEYNFPFCTGDYISLFVRMSCTINLDEMSYSNFTIYQTLKNIYGSKSEIIFNDLLETMKIVEKTWRVKICLN